MCWKIAVVWMGGYVRVSVDVCWCGVCVEGGYKSVCVWGGGGGIGRWVWMRVGGASVGVCDMHPCVCGTCTCTYSIIAVYFKLL